MKALPFITVNAAAFAVIAAGPAVTGTEHHVQEPETAGVEVVGPVLSIVEDLLEGLEDWIWE